MLLMLAYMRGYLEKCSRSVRGEVSGDFVDDFYEDPAALMGSAFPSYRDYYAEGNDGPRRGFIGPHREALDAGLDSAQRWKPPFLQLLTWNNWQEGTQLEPSREERFLRLLRLQKRLVGKNDDAAEPRSSRSTPRPWRSSGRSAPRFPGWPMRGRPRRAHVQLKSGLPRSGHGARRRPPREGETAV